MITNRVETTTKLSALAKGLEMDKALESVTLEICQALKSEMSESDLSDSRFNINQACLIQALAENPSLRNF
jgi:hypothetical protein